MRLVFAAAVSHDLHVRIFARGSQKAARPQAYDPNLRLILRKFLRKHCVR